MNALLVVDQGQVLPGNVFTGEGAKVFILPISDDGRALTPRVLWQGPPFVCPTGVQVISDLVYVTDPCAGGQRTRTELPAIEFTSSAVFVMPLAGGLPTLRATGAPFTSLIKIEDVSVDGRTRLDISDTDSGRLDVDGLAGRRVCFGSYCAPSAAAEVWQFDVLDPARGLLAPPRRTPFTEEGPLTFQFSGVPPDAQIRVTTLGGHMFPDGTTRKVFSPSALDANGRLSVTIASPVELFTVWIEAEVVDAQNRRIAKEPVGVDKDPEQRPQFAHNKKTKVRARIEAAPPQPAAPIPPLQVQSPDLLHLSCDGALGSLHADIGAVWMYREGGGTPVALAMGPPLVRPIGNEISEDGNVTWIADASGALFAIQIPSPSSLARLFPRRFSKICDVDRNGVIDRTDINSIFAARNTPALPGDVRDADGDGMVTEGDARMCVLGCVHPRCEP